LQLRYEIPGAGQTNLKATPFTMEQGCYYNGNIRAKNTGDGLFDYNVLKYRQIHRLMIWYWVITTIQMGLN
jgi:hypothetical protein